MRVIVVIVTVTGAWS